MLPAKLSRYSAVAKLFLKNRALLAASGFDPIPGAPGDVGPDKEAEQLACDLEKLGPTFVKLGQVLSTRSDLLPPAYLDALSRLQDSVDPVPAPDIMQVIEDDLGVRVSKAFSDFDPEPIAAASLGQVHRATLRDGRPVAVKVQRPDITEQVKADLDVLDEIAAFVDQHTQAGRRYEFQPMIREFRKALMIELDYKQEASHLKTLGRNLSEFQRIVVPSPVEGYVSTRVLTMDYVRGTKVTKLNPVTLVEIDPEGLGEEVIRAYLHQILIDGFFHADPHPGNVFITDDGRIALLDLGMVGHTTPQMQDHLLKLLIAVSENKAEDVAELIIRISQRSKDFDAVEFRRRIGQLLALRNNRGLGDINVGKTMIELSQHAADSGLFVPPELTMLGKTLLQLDEVGKVLDPHFNPNESVRRNVGQLMSQRMLKEATQGSVIGSALEMKNFLQNVPARLSHLLDAMANSDVEMRIKWSDAKMIVESIEKVANRITAGVVLAALIIGAALLVRVETEFQIMGYPGLAMIFFLAAGFGGFWLVISTFIRDHRTRKKSPRRLKMTE